jgi:hypothetical protein
MNLPMIGIDLDAHYSCNISPWRSSPFHLLSLRAFLLLLYHTSDVANLATAIGLSYLSAYYIHCAIVFGKAEGLNNWQGDA